MISFEAIVDDARAMTDIQRPQKAHIEHMAQLSLKSVFSLSLKMTRY